MAEAKSILWLEISLAIPVDEPVSAVVLARWVDDDTASNMGTAVGSVPAYTVDLAHPDDLYACYGENGDLFNTVEGSVYGRETYKSTLDLEPTYARALYDHVIGLLPSVSRARLRVTCNAADNRDSRASV